MGEQKPLSKNKTKKIESLMEKASEALAKTEYFDAAKFADEALHIAHSAGDYEQMARIILPLQEARRQIRLNAIDSGNLFVINEHSQLEEFIGDHCTPKAGVYVIEPPLVGADGRNLRDRCRSEKIPSVVLVHEPLTQLRRWPIVMIGPVTVRTQVEPPIDGEITMEWVVGACEAHGDAAIESAMTEEDIVARVDALLDRVGTIIDHEKLMQALEEACREAMRAVAEAA